eukprot:243759_1
MDDFRPLLSNKSKLKTIAPIDTNNNNNNFRNSVNNKFTKTSNNINEFRNEINNIKTMNRSHNNLNNNSNNNIMSQIQHENKEQDNVLDDMKTVLERLQIMSKDIGTEINEQDELINEVHDEADYTRDKMKRVENQMDKLMKKSGLTPCKVIMILSCLIIVLVFLILYS